jgi:cytochrome c-type biogenesis protein CcmE
LTSKIASDTLRAMSKGVQVAGGATIVALLLAWYALANLESGASFAYYKSLAEFQAAPQTETGGPVRVHGYVSLGSIQRDVAAREVRFSVQNAPPHKAGADAGPSMPVIFASLETPDLFKDGAEVVLEGRLRGGEPPAFVADKLLAKCPSKFEGQGPTTADGGARG